MSNGIENIKKYVDKELMWGYIIVVILIVLDMLDIYKSRLVFYFVIPSIILRHIKLWKESKKEGEE
jgi:nicotinamide riboside transporter PnuC